VYLFKVIFKLCREKFLEAVLMLDGSDLFFGEND
jgi:hypothetical protein